MNRQHTQLDSIERKEHLESYRHIPIVEKNIGVDVLPTIYPASTLGNIEGKDLDLTHYQDDMERNVKNSHIIGDSFKVTHDKFIKDVNNN